MTDSKKFEKWFKSQEKLFHDAQYNDMQIAYAAYLYAQEQTKKSSNKIESNSISVDCNSGSIG